MIPGLNFHLLPALSPPSTSPSLILAPRAKNRDDTRVAPINNPPAIVPANLFLFIPDLIPGLTRSPVGESRRRGEGINDGYVGYFSDLEILRFFAGYPSSSNFELGTREIAKYSRVGSNKDGIMENGHLETSCVLLEAFTRQG